MRNKIRRIVIAVMIFAMTASTGANAWVAEAADYSNGGCVRWVKDRVKEKLGITLPATGNSPSGVYGASNYWTVLANQGYARGSEPKAQSVAVWGCGYGESGGIAGNYGHVAYVESVNGNNVEVTEGGCNGYSYNGHTGVIHRTQDKSKMPTLGGCSNFLGYVYLKDTAPVSNWNVYYSSVGVEWVDNWNAGLAGRIENPNRQTITGVGVHIWDSNGVLVVDHTEGCGLSTSYVNQTLNIVAEAKADGLKSGETYTFEMFAGVNGTNVLSSKGTFTCTDSTLPTITDARIVDIDENGYTVSCKATDNYKIDRVQFPTWTEKNDQDDIVKDWVTNAACSGKRDGDVFTFRVNRADHNNEYGTYITHIYAFDKAGNAAKIALDKVEMKESEKEETPATLAMGDVNGDGVISGKDVSYLARAIVGKETLNDMQKKAGDVFPDGEITGKDVSKLARVLVGKETL